MSEALESLELDPGFIAACVSPHAMRAWWREVHPGVFAAQVLTAASCQALNDAITAYEANAMGEDAPTNTMHQRGLLASALGLDHALDALVSAWLAPVAQALFQAHIVGRIAEQHSYFVRYGAGYDVDLGFHVDDAEVTMNLCLHHSGEGSQLYFEGPRCGMHVDDDPCDAERFTWQHRAGVAILHAGKNRHRVGAIAGGVRRNLIIWMRDGGGVRRWEEDWARARCPPWCAH